MEQYVAPDEDHTDPFSCARLPKQWPIARDGDTPYNPKCFIGGRINKLTNHAHLGATPSRHEAPESIVAGDRGRSASWLLCW